MAVIFLGPVIVAMMFIALTEGFTLAGIAPIIYVAVSGALAGRGPNDPVPIGDVIVIAILWLAGLIGYFVLYFLPSRTASKRRVPDGHLVVLINILTGWTIVGWIIAYAMARRGQKVVIAGSHQPALGPPLVSPDGNFVWDSQRQQWLPIHSGPMPPSRL